MLAYTHVEDSVREGEIHTHTHRQKRDAHKFVTEAKEKEEKIL
jgi:hypothetical protein